MISPLYSRKGLDLLEFTLPEMIRKGIRVILQGIGDRNYVTTFKNLADKHAGYFNFIHSMDQEVSHRVIAGTDALLKPSRFEPCGLNQLYALRFGTIPIVHRTGGLDDTVFDGDCSHGGLQTGFKFDEYTPEALLGCCRSGINRIFKSTRMGTDHAFSDGSGFFVETVSRTLPDAVYEYSETGLSRRMAIRRSIFRWIMRWIIIPAVFFYALMWFFHPDKYVLDRFCKQLETRTGIRVEYADVSMGLTGAIRLKRLTIRQASEKTLEKDQVGILL